MEMNDVPARRCPAVGGVHSLKLSIFKPFSHVSQYIGSLEVGRPGSRMEIVAAMRRIRVRPFHYVTSLNRAGELDPR